MTGQRIDRHRLPVPLTLQARCLVPPKDTDTGSSSGVGGLAEEGDDEEGRGVSPTPDGGEGERAMVNGGGGGGKKRPRTPRPPPTPGYPPCDAQPALSAWVHVTQATTVGELVAAVAARCGLEAASVALHGVRKGGGRYEAVPLWPPGPGGEAVGDVIQRPLGAWRAVLFDQAELLVENASDRREHPKSLAESELARRNALVTVGVVRRGGGGEKEKALDGRLRVRQLGAALGLEEGETAELLLEDPLSAFAMGTSLPTRPLVPAPSPEAAEQTLQAAGVGPGSRILIKSAKEAQLLSLRFRVVAGNDRGPKYTRARPGQRGPLLCVEVDRFLTVQDAKAAMCKAARLQVRDVGGLVGGCG
jgi:hypothetical protein